MVIDPNVWVSAVINPFGVPARLVEAVTTGKLVAVVSQHLLDELTAVLIRPKFRRWSALPTRLPSSKPWAATPTSIPIPTLRCRAYATRTTTISSRSLRPP